MPTPISLANPVDGRIQARTEKWDGTSFIVTSTLAEHKASGRALGTDFGDGKCGDTVYAMEAGRLNRWRDPGGALVMRIKHGDGRWSTGYAHLAVFLVNDNTDVKRGQPIATVGKTGATACHLHADLQWLTTHYEVYDYLAQNQEESVTEVTISLFADGAHTCTIPAGGKVDGWTATGTAPSKSQTFPNGSSFPADATVVIKQTPARAPQGTFRRCTAGIYVGLYIPVTQVSLGGPVNPATTYTQAQLDAAVDKAEVDASKRAATDVAAASVTAAKKYGGGA